MEAKFFPKNANAANLAGMMWYLHNEVVWHSPRKFNIAKILRLKVRVRAPQPLYDKGMNFGVRYAYDSGQCTGPFDCQKQYGKYGYFVGCNRFEDVFPFPDYKTYYEGAIWYSLPGACGQKKYKDRDGKGECAKVDPGGWCEGESPLVHDPNHVPGNKALGPPTGAGDCTWNYDPAGSILVNELVGIDDYDQFVGQGNREFSKTEDKGIGLDFWNGINNTEANAARVRKAAALFEKHFPPQPGDEEMSEPPCDFNYDVFYR